MRAIIINNFGGRDQLQLADRPRPVPKKGEVLIRIKAAGANPVDYKLREGLRKDKMPHQFPIILGWDVAGVVEELGPGCRKLKVGDEVFAYCRKPVVMNGAYAEFVAFDEKLIALKPKSLSFEEAAAIPLAGLTAYESLFDAGELKRGQTVLIHAAAGGVGGFAVQLAKWKCARVIATASAANHDYVKSLGAKHVIDYTATDFVAAVRAICPDGVDLAFDTVGGDVQERSARAVKKGGILVSLLAYTKEPELRALGVDCRYVFVGLNTANLRKLAKLADSGKLKPTLAAVLPLADAAKAHEMLEGRHVRGKIVLSVA